MLKQPAIHLTGVSKTYKRGQETITALSEIDLRINKGEFVAITGPSGGGKSTLLQVMGGLDAPTSGIVQVNDVDLGSLNDAELSRFRNQQLGFVFQFFYLQPFLTVGQNIVLPAMFNTQASAITERLHELATLVGLQDRIDHRPGELSGGQMQRCSIARALFNKPSTLLADEPTGNLDSKNAERVVDLFRSINKVMGVTIVMVSHDSSLASKADRIISIKDGTLND